MSKVSFSEASDKQRSDFLVSNTRTQAGVDDAIALLDARMTALETTASERKEANLRRAQLVLKNTKIDEELLAFLADSLSIRPPTKDELETIQAHAATLDAMIAAAETTKTIMKIANKLVSEYNKTKKAAA